MDSLSVSEDGNIEIILTSSDLSKSYTESIDTSLGSHSGYNIKTPNYDDYLEMLLNIKDHSCKDGTNKHNICYQRIVSHLRKCHIKEIVNYFNIVIDCEEDTYGYKIMKIVRDTYIVKVDGLVIRIQNDKIYIVECISSDKVYKHCSDHHLSVNCVVLYSDSAINRYKVGKFIKKYLKGRESYCYIVGTKVIVTYDCNGDEEIISNIEDVEEDFSNIENDLVNNRVNKDGPFAGGLFILALIIIIIIIIFMILASRSR